MLRLGACDPENTRPVWLFRYNSNVLECIMRRRVIKMNYLINVSAKPLFYRVRAPSSTGGREIYCGGVLSLCCTRCCNERCCRARHAPYRTPSAELYAFDCIRCFYSLALLSSPVPTFIASGKCLILNRRCPVQRIQQRQFSLVTPNGLYGTGGPRNCNAHAALIKQTYHEPSPNIYVP